MPTYPCLTCGELSTNTYCATHKPRRQPKPPTHAILYNATYKRQAKIIRDTATACYWCGLPPTLRDPIQADHLYPGELDSPLVPAHRTCNIRRQRRSQP